MIRVNPKQGVYAGFLLLCLVQGCISENESCANSGQDEFAGDRDAPRLSYEQTKAIGEDSGQKVSVFEDRTGIGITMHGLLICKNRKFYTLPEMAEIKKPVCATTKVGELKTDFLYAEETKDKIYLYSVNFPEDSQLLLRLQINSNTTGGEMFLYVPIDKDRAVRCFPSCFDKK